MFFSFIFLIKISLKERITNTFFYFLFLKNIEGK
ncbi:Uncharacterised protein [Sphingobacterium spiritivorum]|uniref:Uncharacterized protein n=1 Tax=Sphingobacterium spiritivorum TaxID=258 RepID=A0A380CAR7_SPHSI|nr:Uncharacterised protein [Sphingobacterium spiritivorum]